MCICTPPNTTHSPFIRAKTSSRAGYPPYLPRRLEECHDIESNPGPRPAASLRSSPEKSASYSSTRAANGRAGRLQVGASTSGSTSSAASSRRANVNTARSTNSSSGGESEGAVFEGTRVEKLGKNLVWARRDQWVECWTPNYLTVLIK